MENKQIKFTISELHFIYKNLLARIEYLEDNPECISKDEGELSNIESTCNKIKLVLL
jgi:hypothetical protein